MGKPLGKSGFRVAEARFGILAKFFAAEICTTSAPPERKTRPRRGKIFG